MATNIYIIPTLQDSRGAVLAQRFSAQNVASATVVDCYTVDKPLNDTQLATLAASLSDPITQQAIILDGMPDTAAQFLDMLGTFDIALDIGFLPGVTDNVGHTAEEIAADSLSQAFGAREHIYSSKLYLLRGDISKTQLEVIKGTLHNPLIERAQSKSYTEFKAEGGMDVVVPNVQLQGHIRSDEVNLEVSDAELAEIGNKGIPNGDGSFRGPLGLSLDYMKAIAAHFSELGRNPRDIELETLAQTWSEHCKHTIFASPIDDIERGIYKHYIKRATEDVRKAKGKNDFCVSVFTDNAGGITFDDGWIITDKVETHNSPSALDPFGGAITGIVGVNRDCVGFGMGAKPIANRYGYCFADPRDTVTYYRDKAGTQPTLSARYVMDGVIAGVEAGGNQSGIPTPQGFCYFDADFIGKPLVFVGTVGLIPDTINGKPSHKKQPLVGDNIVMAGGRVGKDGIHGATFSSVALDEGSPATAVQIGDPITQKKMSDAIIKEARERGLYNAITDNGAGGLSSSVGEMAEGTGGFFLDLEKVPLKYPGMSPWEIWISESQERMTLSVSDAQLEELLALFASRGVEATVIGQFTDSGNAVVSYNRERIMELSMEFLHDGLPEKHLKTAPYICTHTEPALQEPADYADTILQLLAAPNNCSKAFISTQYDHNVQGNAVLGPLQGKGQVYGEASVIKPVFDSNKAVVMSQGLHPRQSHIDCYHMAANAIDMAVRNAVSAGVDINHLAILDNFCWCSSDEAERLGQLQAAAEACYDSALAYGTPFISGKDSMFNDFKGFDAEGNAVKISAPPTLLVSALGVMPHVRETTSMDLKAAGDVLLLAGLTHAELGASEYYHLRGHIGTSVPVVDTKANMKLYKAMRKIHAEQWASAVAPVNLGGIALAASKMALAGQRGLNIELNDAPRNSTLSTEALLFSESAGRLLITASPEHAAKIEAHLEKAGVPVARIGEVTDSDVVSFSNIASLPLADLQAYYTSTFEGY